LIQQELKNPNNLIMLLGNYDKASSKVIPRNEVVLKQIVQYVQKKWNNGVGIYLYTRLSDRQIEMLRNGPFNQTARPRWTAK
jgi:hypothetical protein